MKHIDEGKSDAWKQARRMTMLERRNDLLEAKVERLQSVLADLAPICWLINDTTDRSEADRYYLASTNHWDALHEALHKHADTIRTVER